MAFPRLRMIAYAAARIAGVVAAAGIVFFYFLFVAWYAAMPYLIGPIIAFELVRILT